MNAANLALSRGPAAVVAPLRLNLGCGRSALPGWINIDQVALPGVNLTADLAACRENRLPFDESSVDAFLMSHTIEHIPDTLSLMQELHRIAKPDSQITIRCPYGSSDDADEDPTHVRRYFLQSWLYFSQPAYWRADYGYRGDWQPETVELVVPARGFEGVTFGGAMHRVTYERNVVREMIATLRAVKPAREPLRELQVPPAIKFVLLP